MAFSSSVLELTTDEHVATLWLNRPEQRNAMGRAFWSDLPKAAAAVASNPAIRVVVVAARGQDFTIGLDLKEMGLSLTGAGNKPASRAVSNASTYDMIRTMQGSINAIADLAVPVIAAVHGYCIGGGVDLICAADIRLAASDAVFSVREAKVAIVADLGTLQRLPKIVSEGHVAELAFTGKNINAARANAIGLVNDVAGDGADGVLRAAYELANEIASNSPLAVQGTKAVLRANDGRTVEEGLDFVARWNTLYLQSNDLTEAMTAFLERRPPHFTGS